MFNTRNDNYDYGNSIRSNFSNYRLFVDKKQSESISMRDSLQHINSLSSLSKQQDLEKLSNLQVKLKKKASPDNHEYIDKLLSKSPNWNKMLHQRSESNLNGQDGEFPPSPKVKNHSKQSKKKIFSE